LIESLDDPDSEAWMILHEPLPVLASSTFLPKGAHHSREPLQ
jgi:hypothetical protein